jgi:hypothetical protein
VAHALRNGVIAGAAGTVALNAITYLDMAVSARPPSPLLEKAVDTLAERAGVDLGDERAAEHRKQGLGPLLGMVIGLAVGVAYGVLRERVARVPVPVAALGVGLAASAASNLPMAATGVTDPRQWSLSGWVSDLIPHLGYGLATAATYEAIRG